MASASDLLRDRVRASKRAYLAWWEAHHEREESNHAGARWMWQNDVLRHDEYPV